MTAALVIAPQWIGDAVMTEPLLRTLHARGEQLTVGALPWVAPVYRAMPQVRRVVEFPFAHGGLQWGARRAMARSLRGQFDVAYVCPNSLKSALLPWWAGIPRRVGYVGESRYGLINRRLPHPRTETDRPPMVPWYLALAQAGPDAGLSPHDLRPRLQLDASLRADTLQSHGVSAHGYVVMAPGAEYGPAKRWPEAHFAAVAAALAARGEPVLLLGSGKEAALCEDIAQRAGQPAVRSLAGRTTLDEALALIGGARALLSNDSGLMHVAAALDVPQVAVFGSSSPLHTPPLNPRATVLWLKQDSSYQPPLDCAPCFARTCALGHTRCLNDITPQRVLTLLQS